MDMPRGPRAPLPQRVHGLERAEDTGRMFDGLLSGVRWVILAALLLLTVIHPQHGRTVLPSWSLVAIFIGYNTLVEYLRRRWKWLRSFARVPVLDLPVVALLYYLSVQPGGPLFVLFLLIAICAAAVLCLRDSVVFTALCIVLVAGISPTLPGWRPTIGAARDLGTDVIIVCLVGFGSAILMRQLKRERALVSSGLSEREVLMESERLRGIFISSISHDLRTPLTAAQAGLGMLEASATQRLREDERALAANVRRNIDRLGMLIDDLLTYNQLEAGALTLSRERLDLRDSVHMSAAVVDSLFDEKQQTLSVELPEPLPVEADRHRIEQVILNLLINAHRHTPPGTHVSVTGGVSGHEVRLTVRDDGQGIPREDLERIFQHFHRLASADGGSGLGLANARSLVDLHGGRVWAESEPGQGTAFHIALPCAAAGSDVTASGNGETA